MPDDALEKRCECEAHRLKIGTHAGFPLIPTGCVMSQIFRRGPGRIPDPLPPPSDFLPDPDVPGPSSGKNRSTLSVLTFLLRGEPILRSRSGGPYMETVRSSLSSHPGPRSMSALQEGNDASVRCTGEYCPGSEFPADRNGWDSPVPSRQISDPSLLHGGRWPTRRGKARSSSSREVRTGPALPDRDRPGKSGLPE